MQPECEHINKSSYFFFCALLFTVNLLLSFHRQLFAVTFHSETSAQRVTVEPSPNLNASFQAPVLASSFVLESPWPAFIPWPLTLYILHRGDVSEHKVGKHVCLTWSRIDVTARSTKHLLFLFMSSCQDQSRYWTDVNTAFWRSLLGFFKNSVLPRLSQTGLGSISKPVKTAMIHLTAIRRI